MSDNARLQMCPENFFYNIIFPNKPNFLFVCIKMWKKLLLGTLMEIWRKNEPHFLWQLLAVLLFIYIMNLNYIHGKIYFHSNLLSRPLLCFSPSSFSFITLAFNLYIYPLFSLFRSFLLRYFSFHIFEMKAWRSIIALNWPSHRRFSLVTSKNIQRETTSV